MYIASEKQVKRRAKVILVLQEERAFLWEINLKSLVDRDLRIFGLHLAEIRIRRHIQNEMIAQDELRVHAELALRNRVLKIGIARISSIKGTKAAHNSVRE